MVYGPLGEEGKGWEGRGGKVSKDRDVNDGRVWKL